MGGHALVDTPVSAQISAERKITVRHEKTNGPLTLAHLKALVDMAAAANYPDDALVVSPTTPTGLLVISVRQGEA